MLQIKRRLLCVKIDGPSAVCAVDTRVKTRELQLIPARRRTHCLVTALISAFYVCAPLSVHAQVTIPRSKGGGSIAPLKSGARALAAQAGSAGFAEQIAAYKQAINRTDNARDINIVIMIGQDGSSAQTGTQTRYVVQHPVADLGDIVVRIDPHQAPSNDHIRDLEPFIAAKLEALRSRENIEEWLKYTPPAAFSAEDPAAAMPTGGGDRHNRRVVETFLSAVQRRDAKAIASLLHPTQFGGLNLRSGGNEALLAAARKVMQTFKPISLKTRAVPPHAPDAASRSSWTVDTQLGEKTIELRQEGDVIYIAAIS